MKRISMLTAAVAASVLSAAAAASPASDREEIIQLEHALVSVVDAREFARFYAPGNQPVLYDSFAPGVYRGNAEIVRVYAGQMKGMTGITPKFLEMEVDVSGDLATVFSVQEFHTKWADGNERHVIFRVTDILKRIDGRWLITHQHVSYPYDVATGKTLLDFNPMPAKP